jgi:RNA polymerase sigma factor (sigma-70 family)
MVGRLDRPYMLSRVAVLFHLAPREPIPRHDELALLAGSVQRGNEAALRTLLVAITPHLLRTTRRVLGPQHPEVEDVAQESACAVVDALGRFRQETTFLNFACRIAVLTALSVRRRESRLKRSGQRDPQDPDELMSEDTSPEERAISAVLIPAVRELLHSLPEQQAETLALHTVLGYSLSEVAETCGVPVETVRSRLRLAKRALRERVLDDPQLREVAGIES